MSPISSESNLANRKLPYRSIDDPAALLDELQRNDFQSFLIGAFPQIQGGTNLLPNWHIDAMAYELNRITKGQNRRLLLTLPPRNLKSIITSVAWVAWSLGRDPRLNFVGISYSNDLSYKHARDCRTLMQTAWYRRLFPGTVISASRSAAHDFTLTAGGGRLATSVSGTLTGRGGDIIIIDDPINPREANSQVQRDAVNDWFGSTLASRLNNKITGSIITVMQRLHQYDLAGMLIESDGSWAQLSLPAIARENQDIRLTRGRVHKRREGDVLHPLHEPYEALMDIKRLQGSQYFDPQYQQNPAPAEGSHVKSKWLRYYDGFEPGSKGMIVQSVDTANRDGPTNAYSVITTAHVDRSTVHILDVFRQRLDFPDLKHEVINHARRFKARVLLIEDAASGLSLNDSLHFEKHAGVPSPIRCKPVGDKETRLIGITPQIEAGDLLLPREASWLGEFKSELLGFPNTKYADQVDTLSQLMNWVLTSAGYRAGPVNASPILTEVGPNGEIYTSGGFDFDEGSAVTHTGSAPDELDVWF